MLLIQSKEEFDKLKGLDGAIVQFGSNWCNPCKAVQKLLERMEIANPEIKFAKINVDDNFELASEYKVGTLPTVILLKGANEEGRLTGIKSQEEYDNFVNKLKTKE